MLHIKQEKARKDRYVPISNMVIRGLKRYITIAKPITWLFNGNDSSGKAVPLSQRGIQWVVRETRKKSGILKEVTAHTFRHSYAAHLLELGLDIVNLKEVLGHSSIETTMIYLHISQLRREKAIAPFVSFPKNRTAYIS